MLPADPLRNEGRHISSSDSAHDSDIGPQSADKQSFPKPAAASNKWLRAATSGPAGGISSGLPDAPSALLASCSAGLRATCCCCCCGRSTASSTRLSGRPHVGRLPSNLLSGRILPPARPDALCSLAKSLGSKAFELTSSSRRPAARFAGLLLLLLLLLPLSRPFFCSARSGCDRSVASQALQSRHLLPLGRVRPVRARAGSTNGRSDRDPADGHHSTGALINLETLAPDCNLQTPDRKRKTPNWNRNRNPTTSCRRRPHPAPGPLHLAHRRARLQLAGHHLPGPHPALHLLAGRGGPGGGGGGGGPAGPARGRGRRARGRRSAGGVSASGPGRPEPAQAPPAPLVALRAQELLPAPLRPPRPRHRHLGVAEPAGRGKRHVGLN